MREYPCDPERKDTPACPVFEKCGRCFEDVHHLDYPRNKQKTKQERRHRNREFAKERICRAVHEGIHESGYIPEKQDHDTLASENNNGDAGDRMESEAMLQNFMGELEVQRWQQDNVIELHTPNDTMGLIDE